MGFGEHVSASEWKMRLFDVVLCAVDGADGERHDPVTHRSRVIEFICRRANVTNFIIALSEKRRKISQKSQT